VEADVAAAISSWVSSPRSWSRTCARTGLVEPFFADSEHRSELERRVVLVPAVAVYLLLATGTDLVQCLQGEAIEVEHVRDHDRALEGVGSRLEPREQITRPAERGGLMGQRTHRRALIDRL
jgi:hypothetical protein